MLMKLLHSKTTRITILLVTILILAAAPFQWAVSAQTTDWSAPLELSSAKASSSFPDVLVDASGRVHVFWASGIGNYDVVMYRSLIPNKGWTDVNDIAALALTSGRIITRPNGVITPDGTLYMLFRNFTLFGTSVPAQVAQNARLWSKASQLSSGNNIDYFSRIAVDSKGTLHLFYTENTPSASCSLCFYLYYRQSTDSGATWTDPKPISDPNNGVAKPQVLVDPQDRIHVVYEAGQGGDLGTVDNSSTVMYVSSSDGGKSWSEPQPFAIPPKAATTPASPKAATPTPDTSTTPDLSSKFITIGRDGQGKLVVVWDSITNDLVYYAVSADNGGTWSTAQVIPAVWGGWAVYPARTDDYSMASDSAGMVHLIMAGRTSQTGKFLSLLHLVWNGQDWSAPESIKEYHGDVPEWPRIAVGNGNQLHAVWFERDKAHIFNSDAGLYTIWYAQGVANAPALQPTIYPTLTSTPGPSPTPEPFSTQAPTAEPTLAPMQSIPTPAGILGFKNPAYTESDYLVLVAKTLLPTVAFLGLVIIGVVIFRRR